MDRTVPSILLYCVLHLGVGWGEISSNNIRHRDLVPLANGTVLWPSSDLSTDLNNLTVTCGVHSFQLETAVF